MKSKRRVILLSKAKLQDLLCQASGWESLALNFFWGGLLKQSPWQSTFFANFLFNVPPGYVWQCFTSNNVSFDYVVMIYQPDSPGWYSSLIWTIITKNRPDDLYTLSLSLRLADIKSSAPGAGCGLWRWTLLSCCCRVVVWGVILRNWTKWHSEQLENWSASGEEQSGPHDYPRAGRGGF